MAQKEKGREVLSAGAGLAAEVALESGGELGEITAVRARGYWEQVWIRFKKDKVAIASGFVIILLILAAFPGAPLAEKWLEHGPNDIFPTPGVGVDMNLVPVGPNTHATNFNPETGREEAVYFPLGTADTLGRDELLRLMYGARVSLEVAIGATLLSMFIGVLVGGVFGWFYPARIIRAQVLSLREKEFIEAAQMVGSSDWRIIRSHLLPHLVAPIIVYSTLIVAQFVLFEAGLSF